MHHGRALAKSAAGAGCSGKWRRRSKPSAGNVSAMQRGCNGLPALLLTMPSRSASKTVRSRARKPPSWLWDPLSSPWATISPICCTNRVSEGRLAAWEAGACIFAALGERMSSDQVTGFMASIGRSSPTRRRGVQTRWQSWSLLSALRAATRAAAAGVGRMAQHGVAWALQERPQEWHDAEPCPFTASRTRDLPGRGSAHRRFGCA